MKTIQKAMRNVKKLTMNATDKNALKLIQNLREPIWSQDCCSIQWVIKHYSEN